MKNFDGPIAGFVFRTDTQGTGYYRDSACDGGAMRPKQSEPIPIQLHSLIKLEVCSKALLQNPAGEEAASWPKSKHARRARQADGKRRKHVSRRKLANRVWREGAGNDPC